MREYGNVLFMAGQDVLAIYNWGFNMTVLPERVFSQKMKPNLRITSENKIKEVFPVNSLLAYIWIGKERWAYNISTKTLSPADIIDNSAPVDIFLYQTAHYGWNLWFTSETDFVIKNHHDDTPLVVNSHNIQGSSVITFPIVKILGFKVAGNAWFTLVEKSPTIMFMVIGEVGRT